MKLNFCFALGCVVLGPFVLMTSDSLAQGFGGSGAAYENSHKQQSPGRQSAARSSIETIQVTGSAEITVEPEALRLVFAVAHRLATESKVGFKMQTNLHVMCKNEEQALAVIDIAF